MVTMAIDRETGEYVAIKLVPRDSPQQADLCHRVSACALGREGFCRCAFACRLVACLCMCSFFQTVSVLCSWLRVQGVNAFC